MLKNQPQGVIRPPGRNDQAKEKVMLYSARTLPRWTTLAVALSCQLVAVFPTTAHEAPKGWSYPWACCSNQDCQEVTARSISERPEGYVVAQTGEVIPYLDKRVKDSPDGEFHRCAHKAGLDAGRTICLFVPPRGF